MSNKSEFRVFKKYQTNDNLWYSNNLRIYPGGYQIFLNPRYLLQEHLSIHIKFIPSNVRSIISNYII
jgi:hypothetical protein